MAITYPRSLPAAPGFKTSSWGLDWNNAVFDNPVTRVKKTNERSGTMWTGVLTLPPMLPETAREWEAWINSLRGTRHPFLLGHPDYSTPYGVADTGSDTPLLQGAVAAFVSSFPTDGWRASTTSGLLKVGDYFSIANELKQVVEQVDGDASGVATINFHPPTHRTIADNTPIVFENPTGQFRMSEDLNLSESNEFGVSDFSFAVEEYLN